MRISTLILFLVTGMMTSFAEAVVWSFPQKDYKELRVRAKFAQLNLRRATGDQLEVRITGSRENSWSQSVEDGRLVLVGPETGTNVMDSQITLLVPVDNIPLYFVFEEVRAELDSVFRVHFSAVKGRVDARQLGEGGRFFLQSGELNSSHSQGGLDIESYGGKINITDSRGPFKVKLFSGDLKIERSEGALILDAYSSTAKIANHKGNLALHWGKGLFQLTDFVGRLDGQSQDGQLQIGFKHEVNLELDAARGKVNLKMPPNSGTYVNLRTSTGELSVPAPLHVAKEGRFRVVRGRMSGGTKGQAVIRTDEAAISLR